MIENEPHWRKPDFCLCENKGADQLRSNCKADQHLCFRYMDSTIPLLFISKISSILLFSMTVQAWSETPKTSFLASRLSVNNLFTRDAANLLQSRLTKHHTTCDKIESSNWKPGPSCSKLCWLNDIVRPQLLK